MSMGARPIAIMDPLRFGNLHHPDTLRVLPGIVAGVGGYGNCLGLPNIGGEVVFDDCYQGNPLVNALCVGAMRIEDIHLASARGAGNKVVLFGAKTGGDGIGGVSVLASETFAEGGPTKRPAVQVGDPFAEKVLIECCLDLYAAKVVAGIQDLGGAGLSCATSELASNGDGGMRVALDLVPLRDASLRPEEILMSESQERMMAVVEPQPRRVPRDHRQVGRRGDRHRRGDRRRPAGRSRGTTRRSSTSRRAPWPTTVPSTTARSRDPHTWMRCRRTEPTASSARHRQAAARDPADDARHAQPLRQVLGHQAVRPLRHGQHRAGHARRRRRRPRRRGDRPRRRGLHRLQRPVRQARPVCGCAARAGRGLPERRDRRRAPRWPSPTASTSGHPRTRA